MESSSPIFPGESPREPRPLRVLYSFAHKIGAGRICNTAWHQVAGAAAAGAEMTVLAGSQARPLPDNVRIRTTLSRGRVRIPMKVVGRKRACQLHDWMAARWLRSHHHEIDVVHGWPLCSLELIKVARQYGIPCVLERPNAHTAFAYEVVAEENRRVGIELPSDHDHQFNADTLAREKEEYAAADFLLCPSDFVARTFTDQGISAEKLIRHQYGYDHDRFHPAADLDTRERTGLVVLYAGVCEPRKGLHYALDAWLASGAQERGRFLVCGDFVPGYAEKLSEQLAHPSVEVLGHRRDLPDLMRESDIFILPSVEEGSALVTYEARASGCVLVVSDASGAVGTHAKDVLIHPARDLETLKGHLQLLDHDRALLGTMRRASLARAGGLTWTAAGKRLVAAYHRALRKTQLVAC